MCCVFKWIFKLLVLAAIIFAGLVIYLLWFQKPFDFPKPTGDFAVGSIKYHWINENRKETLQQVPGHPNREIMVQIWYPSLGKLPEVPTTPYAQYAQDYAWKTDKLTWLAEHSRPIYVWAVPDAKILEIAKQFPVIIFSHGFTGRYDINTAQCEELASHGYVVVGIGHTFDSILMEFSDKRIAKISEKKLGRFTHPLDLTEEEVDIRVADAQFVLDQITKLNSDPKNFLYNKLDLNKIGMFGHSLGGITTIKIMPKDSRIKAGAALDSPLFGKNLPEKFNQPFMFMLQESIYDNIWVTDNPQKRELQIKWAQERYIPGIEKFSSTLSNDVYNVTIKGAKHMAFCDLALIKQALLLSPLFNNLGVGPINGFESVKIINSYLVAFFDKYLENKRSELLEGKIKPFSEVELKSWIRNK
ncbi:hypothetical protein K9L05_03840 [Candidatus Babeliales bacterium]|nr:hypothetical protein [Candidatus Babeliales bacterium]MCF7899748.1 hypothetical protein [Candidatus Babeliales bacterium]